MNDDVMKLLVEADPITDPEHLRLPQPVAEARCEAIVARTPTLTTGPTQTGSPHRRRSMVWAFATAFTVILLAVGAAAFFLGDDNTPVADEPAPSPAVTNPEGATTVVEDSEPATFPPGWQRIDNPWLVRDETSIAPLPGGGFVAASRLEHPDGSHVMWSPDGLNWFDGDPQRLLPRQDPEFMWSPGVAVVGDQVLILTDDLILGRSALGLWLGDPRTGSWEPRMALDTGGLAGNLVPGTIGISAGDDAALVAAVTATGLPPDGSALDEIGSVVVWLLDPEHETALRTVLPVDTAAPYAGAWPMAWFDGRWHVMVPLGAADYEWVETALWSSADGTTWTEDEFPEGWKMGFLNWLTTGPSGVVTCAVINGNEETAGMWFSPNGVDWHFISGIPNYCRGVYSDSLGFVLEGAEDGFYRLSPDGEALEVLVSPFPADTVAASGNNLIVHAFRGSEYSPTESAGMKGPWLYHQPDDE